MIRRPPRSTPFPTRRSSDLPHAGGLPGLFEQVTLTGELHWCGAGAVAKPEEIIQRAHRLQHAGHRLKGPIAPQDRKSTRLELQSRQYLVCRLLLEKKKNITT